MPMRRAPPTSYFSSFVARSPPLVPAKKLLYAKGAIEGSVMHACPGTPAVDAQPFQQV